nr:stage II sporulation protein M [Asticcacaulis aquaticus]
MWLSFACFFLGAVGGWLMCAFDPSWYNALVGHSAQGRDTSATAEDLRKTLGGAEKEQLGTFSVYLMSNNTRVTLMAFAVGVIGGVPTAFVLLYNGMMLGAMMWLFASKGLGFDFAAWLSIHGTTEMLAIIIGGGAGFHLARRLMFPGHLTRKAALSTAGRTAGTVMLGAMLMLIIAGVIEGVGRQTITDMGLRFAFGGVMLVWWLTYYGLFGRDRKGAGDGQNP